MDTIRIPPGLILACTLITAGLTEPALSESPNAAPPLPDPTGQVIRVADVDSLYRAVSTIQSGTTIVLEQGTYQLTRPVVFPERSLRGIALRGASADWNDVILTGNGMNDDSVWHGIMVDDVTDLLIAHLTIRDVACHCVTVAPAAHRPRIFHCRLLNAGEQFVKVNSDGQGGGANEGVVEYSVLEYSDRVPDDGYTNGVDIHGGRNWVIRHNLFRRILTPPGADYSAVPAVLAWNGAANTLCEGNTFVDCDRAIAFGLIRRDGYADHRGGIIRNNFIVSRPETVPSQDCGIFVHSPGAVVLHNTVLQNGGYPNAIEVRWPGTPAVVQNNLVDAAVVPRDGARISAVHNESAATAEFRDAAAGDLHLMNWIRSVPGHPHAPTDWDSQRRPAETVPGADN